MSILDTILAQIAPHSCKGCGLLGSVLCGDCATMVQTLPSRCYKCMKTTVNFKTCSSCKPRSGIQSIYAWGNYSDALKSVIHALKYERAYQAAHNLADSIPLPTIFLKNAAVVPVPTTPSRVRQRGYDQAVLLAKALGPRLQLPVVQLLHRTGSQHQVGATGTERRSQLSGVFKTSGSVPRNVILIDDVLTTGATLEEAARTLKKAGARHVQAIVIAQA